MPRPRLRSNGWVRLNCSVSWIEGLKVRNELLLEFFTPVKATR